MDNVISEERNDLKGLNDVKETEKGACTVFGRTFDSDIGEFYFESDELALKGNADYLNLLRTVAILEAQRMKAISDLDRLAEAEREALSNPIEFVERLQRNEDLNLPGLQRIASLPIIDFSKYTHNFNLLQSSGHRHVTRQKKGSTSFGGGGIATSDGEGIAGTSSALEVKTDSDDCGIPFLVRGRLFGMNKSQTFNQLWSIEEQKKLEELLVKHPPEEVEARRWEKIAKELVNRTPQQVASRVQKYFIKLTKAGLPVPGRIPNMSTYQRKAGPHHHHRQHRHNRFLFQPSTFLASYEPPVLMSEFDDDASSTSCNFSGSSSVDNDYGWSNRLDGSTNEDDEIPAELKNTEEYRELMFLKDLKLKKMKEQRGAEHIGYKCDSCHCEPIVGTRWHCVNCPSDDAVDLCNKCIDGDFENEVHLSSHCLEPIRDPKKSSSYVDGDYMQFHGNYNYLDPNYMPAM